MLMEKERKKWPVEHLPVVYAWLTLQEGSQTDGNVGGGLVWSFAGLEDVPFPNLHKCHLARGSSSVGCLP